MRTEATKQVIVRGLSSVLAGSAFLMLLFGSWYWAAAAIAAIAGVVSVLHRRLRPSGGEAEAIVLVTGAAAGATRALSDRPDLALIAAATVMIGLTLIEPALRGLANATTRARNLAVRRRLPPPGRWLHGINIVLAVGLAVCAAVAVPPWPVAVAAVLIGGAAGWSAVAALARKLRPPTATSPVRRALTNLAPTFLLHFSAPPGSAYQITMWLPYLERIGRPFVIVVREAENLAPIASRTSAPVIFCPTLRALEEVIVPSLRAAFYVNHAAKNSNCVRFRQLTHIQIHHGDSDKATSYSAVSAMFDLNFVAGEAAIDRYKRHGVHIPRERFRIVGRPQVEAIADASARVGEPIRPTVLYAPTWTGHFSDVNYSSLPIAERLIRELVRHDTTVMFRPHPYSSRNPESARQLTAAAEVLREDRERTGRAHVFGAEASRMSLTECFNASDVLVTDVSSVASDYLFSGKPFALTDMVGAGDVQDPDVPMARAAYVLLPDLSNIDEVIGNMLHADPLQPVRKSLRTYYLGDIPAGTYADAFVRTAREYC